MVLIKDSSDGTTNNFKDSFLGILFAIFNLILFSGIIFLLKELRFGKNPYETFSFIISLIFAILIFLILLLTINNLIKRRDNKDLARGRKLMILPLFVSIPLFFILGPLIIGPLLNYFNIGSSELRGFSVFYYIIINAILIFVLYILGLIYYLKGSFQES
jgi:hypothetical protein